MGVDERFGAIFIATLFSLESRTSCCFEVSQPPNLRCSLRKYTFTDGKEERALNTES